ncbi:MAG: hypothetical protein IJ300_08760 [Clostridia bacterium]|nr:hypothetical protein [Clostridia bacterium]
MVHPFFNFVKIKTAVNTSAVFELFSIPLKTMWYVFHPFPDNVWLVLVVWSDPL